MNSLTDDCYDDPTDDHRKQVRPFPAHLMTVPARLKVGTKIRLLDHIALRLGTRTSEFKDWDQIVTVLEVHNGRGQFPPRDIADEEDDGPIWAGQTAGYLLVSLPYPYSYRHRNEDGTYVNPTMSTCCSLDSEGTEWEVA